MAPDGLSVGCPSGIGLQPQPSPTIFATHHFGLGETMSAYDTFADAAATNALKVVLEGSERAHGSNGRIGASVVAGPA